MPAKHRTMAGVYAASRRASVAGYLHGADDQAGLTLSSRQAALVLRGVQSLWLVRIWLLLR